MLQKGDESLLFPLHSDPEVMLKIKSPDKDIEQTRQRVNEILQYMKNHPHHGLYLAFLEDEFIGWGVLTHIEAKEEHPIEVGYRLHKKFWGKGYATEIATFLKGIAKEKLGLKTLCGITAEDNLASINVLKKIGMQWQQIRKYYGLYVEYFEVEL